MATQCFVCARRARGSCQTGFGDSGLLPTGRLSGQAVQRRQVDHGAARRPLSLRQAEKSHLLSGNDSAALPSLLSVFFEYQNVLMNNYYWLY